MDERQRSIGVREMALVFLRSLLIQSSWSFDRMQSLGFAYAMMPALRRLYPDNDEYRRRIDLHLDYFNTQPYLASFVLGAAVRMEEERASGRNRSADVAGMKNTLMAPLGALGDSFFWGSLKPMLIVVAVAAALTGAWWAPLLFLAVYNVAHLWLRARMLVWGYRSSGDFLSLMARYRFTTLARIFKTVTLAALGGMLGLFPLWRPELGRVLPASGLLGAGAGLLITLVLSALLKQGLSPLKLMLGLIAVCLALAYAGVG